MATQRMYSHSLVGFLVMALLAVLVAGGCENSSSTSRHALEADYRGPGLVGSTGMTYAEEDDAGTISDEPTGVRYEAGIPMGYREPGYSMETGAVTEEEYSLERTGDMDDESSETSTTSMSCYGEEEASTEVTEECGLVEEDESTYQDAASVPVVTEEEGTSAQNNDMEDGDSQTIRDEAGEASAVIDEEGTRTDNGDESYSNTVAPWIGGEDETTPDSNLDDTTSDTSDTADDTPVGESSNDPGSEPLP